MKSPLFSFSDLFVGAAAKDVDELRRALPSAECNIRYAMLLGELAELKIKGPEGDGQGIVEGIVVLVKALDQLNNAVIRTHGVISKMPVALAYAHDLLTWLQVRLSEGLAKADGWVNDLTEDAPESACAEAIVYDHAVTVGREAAVDELLGNIQLSHQRFAVAATL